MIAEQQNQQQTKLSRYHSNNQEIFQTIRIQQQQSNQDKIEKQISQRYTIQERMYLIINKYIIAIIQQTGQVYDSKNQKVIDNLFKHTQFQQINNKWNNYWKILNDQHQKLIQVCTLGKVNQLIQILQKKQIPIDINFKSFDDWTALHFAVYNAKVQCLSVLIKYKANINQTTKFGWTPLHIAAKKNEIPGAILLIQSGCNLNLQDQQFYTPLHYAAENGYVQMVSLLLNYGCDQNLKNCQGRTPKQSSQNIDIYKLFKNQEQNQMSYSKQVFGGVLLPNSRRDHIQKFLNLSPTLKPGSQLEKKQKIKTTKFVNILKMYQTLQAKKNECVSTKDFIFYKLLGKGSFGEVYLVKKIQDERLYAMKIIKKQKVLGTNLFRYIQTQRDVLSLIMHPFVVRLYYSFQNEGKLFLVMQYCQGGDLSNFLQKKKKFSQQISRIYIAEIILALEALHKNMIIYRDLKPENLVLDKDGHVMITDFGLSKKGQIQKMTSSFCGTPAYLAPQILDKKGHNRMADWYQLGVVLYQFLVGTPPFYAPTRQELYKNKRQNILKIPKNLTPQCKDLIKRLLQKDPNKRLGIEKDGESIRQHPWFKKIDWQKVYNKQLVPPKPEIKKINFSNPITIKFNQDTAKQRKDMPQWTFVT